MLKQQTLFIATALIAAGVTAARAQAEPIFEPAAAATVAADGAVYTASNEANHNQIVAFRRSATGALTFLNTYSTGGRGAGGAVDPLQSQNSLLLSPDHKFLFAVNAGSGTISIFKVASNQTLSLITQVASGGGFPVGLAIHDNLLYVLNAGGAGNVTGFWLKPDGHLQPIQGATHLLTGASAGGASIDFSPDGQTLAVTERLNNLIDTFTIGPAGGIVAATTTPSHGNVPFSLAFTRQGALVVAEAGGNPAGGSALSSYLLQSDDTLTVSSASVPTGFNAACWIIVSDNGKFAFSSNAGSGQISTASIGKYGELSIVGAAPTGPGTVPIDIALSANSKFLYALTAGKGTVTGFRVNGNGSLTPVTAVGALPAASGQNGIAAY